VNDLLELAIAAHGGLRRWEQIKRFRAAASITGAVWALKGKPGLLDDVVLEGETRAQRLTTAPFLFARHDFVTEETGPWPEDGEIWRRLLVTYPDIIVAHHRQQTYYFDDRGLLRRLDYSIAVDLADLAFE
jgi:hypothetical protein